MPLHLSSIWHHYSHSTSLPAIMSLSLIAPSRARCITVPVFLCPAFTESSTLQPRSHRAFSTSPSTATRRTTGPNKQRGVSAIRSKSPVAKTEVYKYDLPTPVLDPSARTAFKMNPDHGLWGFFQEKREALAPAEYEYSHGRAWAIKELQTKSFEDLHKLYWVCVLEMNRIATRKKELSRTSGGFGENDQIQRMATVRCYVFLILLEYLPLMNSNFTRRYDRPDA